MKDTSLWLILAEVVVAFGLSLPILLICANWLFSTHATRTLFILTPVTYISIYILDYKIKFLPDFPDSHGYKLALTSDTLNASLPSAYFNFHYLNTPLRVLGGGVPTYMVVNSIMFVIGATLVWRSWTRFTERRPIPASNIVFLILLNLWPGGLLYNSSLLREGQTLFFFGVLMYISVLLYTDPTWVGGYLLLPFFLFGMSLLRKELIPALIIFLSLLVYSQQVRNLKMTIIYTSLLSGAGYLLLRLLGFLYLFSPATLSRLRNDRAARFNAPYLGDVTWNNWVDILPDIAPLTLKFLISPLTLNPSPLEWFVATADAIFIIITISWLTVWILKHHALKNSETAAWLLGLVVLSVGFGLIEVNATGAPRHRMPIVLMLLPSAATALVELLNGYVSFKWRDESAQTPISY